MLSLWLIFLLFTFTIFVCFLLIYSAYHITISAHFIVLLSLVFIPTTNVISKNHDFGVLTLLSFSSVSRVAILFLSFFFNYLCFQFDLTVPFLLCFPYPNNAWPCLSSAPHVTLLLHLCWTKTGDKVKVALHLTLQILLDMLYFWPLFTQLCSPGLCLLLNLLMVVFTNFASHSFTSILCPFFRRFCLHISVSKPQILISTFNIFILASPLKVF